LYRRSTAALPAIANSFAFHKRFINVGCITKLKH
jgi:hypothetical protein